MWLNERPRRDLPLPVWQRGPWQRGHRVHGYWLDGQRMGCVMLSPHGVRPATIRRTAARCSAGEAGDG
jgi:hypothetical protein